ncbi:MAG: hypothetical protein CSA55_03690 [Ilumatobacter coccineus]|uniref:Phosphoribosyltransferase domain-containing protein n=1 Tax=Ilumatobacter coccineus TaxID=467094 RepID=A0A2G6K9B0_9ACTN|nr:MAG: hypothetical protein CSA55_03690 [Ilumatobacter coccineus]
MIFEQRCAGCGKQGPILCRSCRFGLARPAGRPHRGDVIAALPYVGRARRVVMALKYANRRQIAHHLAGLVVNAVVASGIQPVDLDVVTWAPTSRRRIARRGVDQAELVARRVAAQLGVPCRRLLRRDGPDRPQTGLSRAHRLHGPVFSAHPGVSGKRVLVIDDVVTTGSTLSAAAAALMSAGALTVEKAVVAATPSAIIPGSSWPNRSGVALAPVSAQAA